jgi:hypothetical protein
MSLGYAVLREMMHGDAITYNANGERHIKGLQMKMRPLDESRGWDWWRAYGAQFAKILARTQNTNLGKWSPPMVRNS